MCNGQCSGSCGKDKPKTVNELLKDLNSDMPYAEFENVKEQLANAINSTEDSRLKTIEHTQQEHTDLLSRIIESQSKFLKEIKELVK